MKRIILFLLLTMGLSVAQAKPLKVAMYRTVENGKKAASIGTITFENGCYGLIIKPELHGLKPGMHGFHIHQNPDCTNLGMNAGSHFDPENTGKHLGPYDKKGHLGDLPPLFVDKKGKATLTLLAPRLNMRDLPGHSIIIHADGDNFSDTPKPLGGGGKRVACGVVAIEKPSKPKKEKQ